MLVFDDIEVCNNTCKKVDFYKVLCKKVNSLFFRELVNVMVLGGYFIISNKVLITKNIASARGGGD